MPDRSRAIFLSLLAFTAALWVTDSAHAAKRIALLIGNQSYKSGVGKLVNPLNDIKIVGAALRKVGFEVLKPVVNATRVDILDALDHYTSKLRHAGSDAIGFIYYSGHGIASRGANYLIPVDVAKPSTRLLRAYGLKQSEILAILRKDAPLAVHYIVIDACRNELQGARGAKGFLPVVQQAGMLIAFATAPGQTASDIGDGGGPYAKALAAEIVKPGVPDLLMFHNVRVAVSLATGGDQVPWTLDGIRRSRRFMFGGIEVPAPQPPMSEAAVAWRVVEKSSDCGIVRAFAAQYAGTIWARFAQSRLSSLNCGSETKVTHRKCDGISVSLGTGDTICIKPGASKGFKDCDACPNLIVVSAGQIEIRSLLENGFSDELSGSSVKLNFSPSRRFNYNGHIWKARLAKPLAVTQFLISVREFDEFRRSINSVSEKKCWQHEPNGSFRQKSRRRSAGRMALHLPATCNELSTIKAYAKWLSAKSGRSYRLLTAAEWEYIAGPGVNWELSNKDLVAQVRRNSMYAHGGAAIKRGLNQFSLGDLHGGYYEWVEDCGRWSGRHQARRRGRFQDDVCFPRLIRWDTSSGYPMKLRTRTPDQSNPQGNNEFTAFRLARELN